ncbi:MAG: hypothetical protein K2X03_24200 [Bryobacteraceae bacterium]|nr:hypothetical protein [Bryobacteraceae bacterium]
MNNTGSRAVTIQYVPPPVISTSFGASTYNGTLAATWGFNFSDSLGAQNIDWITISFSAPGINQTFPNSCTLYLFPGSSSSVYLANDAATSWSQGVPGSLAQIRNTQCLIDMKGFRLTFSGNNLGVNIPLYGDLSFAGNRDIWLTAGNRQGQYTPPTRVWSNYPISYWSTATTLAGEPYSLVGASPTFRASAMLAVPNASVYYMHLASRVGNDFCQLMYFAPPSSAAYLYSNNPYGFSSVTLPNSTFTLTNPFCTVPAASIQFNSYLQASPPTPYAFLTAQFNKTPAMPVGYRYTYAQMNYLLFGSGYGTSELWIGDWLVQNPPL